MAWPGVAAHRPVAAGARARTDDRQRHGEVVVLVESQDPPGRAARRPRGFPSAPGGAIFVAMPGSRRLRILIAEDDESVASLYRAYAERRGHEVLLARDGAETLVTTAAEMPDIVILDVGMPKLDGRDVCRQLKQNPKTAGIPILVVSALGGDQNVRSVMLELGAWDVLEKPVDLQICFNKAERLVERAAGEPA